jgi:hypothetical protein
MILALPGGQVSVREVVDFCRTLVHEALNEVSNLPLTSLSKGPSLPLVLHPSRPAD